MANTALSMLYTAILFTRTLNSAVNTLRYTWSRGGSILPLVFDLLSACPLHQLLPASALVFSLESIHSVDPVVPDLGCNICMAHESLSQKIDAVLNMMRLHIHRQFCRDDLFTAKSCVIELPVGLSNSILYTLVLVSSML